MEKQSTENQAASNIVDLENVPDMSSLLGEQETPEQIASFAPGNIVKGKVVGKTDNSALVDIGYKSEGVIPREEFDDFPAVEGGQDLEVYIELLEDEEAEMPLLSVRKAQLQKAWDYIIDNYEEGTVVKGQIKRRVKGGLIVDIGVDAFLPGSQIDVSPVKNLEDYIGTEEDVKILKISPERRNIVVSRRELISEERDKQRAELIENLEIGQVRTGTVKNITDFGAFIDLQGVDGLLHITDMSWGRVSHPGEIVKVGDEIEVMILDIDEEKQRVSLGMKQKEGDPWENVEEKYPAGTRVQGRVVNVLPYGAFVELEEGIEGLIHVSEMSWVKKVNKASEMLSVGDEVEAVVLSVEKETRKISLSLRQTTENPWQALADKFPPGSRIKGKVRNMTTFGAFIQVDDDIDGMIHVSDMSWTRKIHHPSEVLEKGQEVEAVVLDIDPEQQRISLGLKQLIDDPWANIEEHFQVGDKVQGKVTKVTSYGAFVRLYNDVEGLLHISELKEEHVDNVSDVISEGEELEARVVKIDTQERRIGLSLKQPAQESEADRSAYTAKEIEKGGEMVTVGDVFQSVEEKGEEQEESDEGESAETAQAESALDEASENEGVEEAAGEGDNTLSAQNQSDAENNEEDKEEEKVAEEQAESEEESSEGEGDEVSDEEEVEK